MPRLDFLDSVRGLAALIVFNMHFAWQFFRVFPVTGWLERALNVPCDGQAGVSMFFVLSGFVLSRKYFKDKSKIFSLSRDFLSFIISRICRICIPFCSAVILCALLHIVLYDLPIDVPFPATGTRPNLPSEIKLYNLWQELNIFMPPGLPCLLPQGWSLTTEINISMWMPFMILIATQSVAAVSMCALYAVYWLSAPFFLFHFILGIFLARHLNVLVSFGRKTPRYVILCGFVLGFFLFGYRHFKEIIPEFLKTPNIDPLQYYITGLGSAILLLCIFCSDIAQKFLSIRPLTYLGKISYSFYLLHYAAIALFVPGIFWILSESGLKNISWLNPISYLTTLLIIVLFSGAHFKFIENPSIRLGKWLGVRFQKIFN